MAGITAAALGISAPAAPNPKLVHAAHEFEAQMMKELLAPMTGGDPLTGDLAGDEDRSGLALGSGSGSGGALADFAAQALGQALSERGGFGIADRIVRELGHTSKLSESSHLAGAPDAKVTKSLHGNTVMRKHE
jgi:Rod binding domain-containing protein